MENTKLFYQILNLLESNHLNLYHSITKEEIKRYIDQMSNLDELNEIEFDYEMLKFFALFKDAHTSYYIKYKYLDRQLYFIENKLIIKDDEDFKEIVKIGNLSVDEFISKMAELQNYETQEFLCDSIRASIKNGYYYEMLGLLHDDCFECEVLSSNGIEKVYVNIITREQAKELGITNGFPNYRYEILDNNILYIKYRKCVEYEQYPFIEFVKTLKNKIESNNISKYILDLRDNHGGNSSIIKPLIKLIKEKRLDGVLIINNGVFSAGRWAVADFKKAFGSILIGEGTGGAAVSYGNNSNFELEGKKFSVSIKFIDKSKECGCTGSIQPDIYVSLTLEDFINNYDRQLDAAINHLTKELTI